MLNLQDIVDFSCCSSKTLKKSLDLFRDQKFLVKKTSNLQGLKLTAIAPENGWLEYDQPRDSIAFEGYFLSFPLFNEGG